MDFDRNESTASAFLQLGAVIALASIAATGALAAAVMLHSANSVAAQEPECGACGTVERVRVITPPPPRHEVSTVAGGGLEGVAVVLGALSGRITIAPLRYYEIEVRMKDGSTRAFHEGEAPIWQPGDRVRILTGKVVPPA
jgi:hypothetical protein